MAALPVMRRSGCMVEAKKVWWRASARRGMSAFDDQGSVLREEERSREALYIRKKEAELLEKLRKQGDKLEEIKRALLSYKENQTSIENWLTSKVEHPKQILKEEKATG